MSPWGGSVPSLGEALELLPDCAEQIHESPQPVTITSVLDRANSNEYPGGSHNVREQVAAIEWSYSSFYHGRDVTQVVTLLQVVRGGLAPDGWAYYDTYRVNRRLTADEARVMLEVIHAGLPLRIVGGDL